MQKLQGFVIGLLVGAGVMFVALKYHIVRSDQGFHMIPKVSAALSAPYTDIREFSVEDWRSHQDLVLSIAKSKNTALQEAAAKGTVDNTLEDAWRSWMGQ